MNKNNKIGYDGYIDATSNNRLTGLSIPQTSDGYVQGYTRIAIPGLTYNGKQVAYYFVTNYGDQNPGLRSQVEFNANQTQPGLSDGVALPPNAFYNQATITVNQSKATINQASVAAVGTMPFPTIAAAPTGSTAGAYNVLGISSQSPQPGDPNVSTWPMTNSYIVFDNTPQQTYTGPFPGHCDNIFCDQLGAGIYVLADAQGNGLLYSQNLQYLNFIGTWWVQSGAVGGTTAGLLNFINNFKTTTINGVSGSTILANMGALGSNNQAVANTICDYAYVPGIPQGYQMTSLGILDDVLQSAIGGINSPPSITICTDMNSDPVDSSHSPVCASGLALFSNSYYPSSMKTTISMANVTGLTAAEMAKDMMYQFFQGVVCADGNPTSGSGPSGYSYLTYHFD